MELRASNMNRPLLGEAGTSITPGYSRNVSFDSTVQSDGTSKNNTRIAQLNVQNKQFMNNRISTSRYNWCNFIPKTVFMQFRRVANVYFLIMGILMWVGTNYPTLFTSPLSPGSTVGPLLVIIILTCIKEGLEDLKRHRSDGTTNGRKQCVLNPKSTATVAATATTLSDVEEIEDFNSWCEPTKNEKWKDVRVGQYVFVRDKEQMPADVVVLCSSNGDGCFIETSNIDGETNLKIREVPTKILDMVEQERKRLAPLGLWQGISDEGIVKSNEQTAIDILRSTNGTLEFEPPNRSIHTFVGTLKMALKDGGSSCRLNPVEDDMVTAPLSSRNFLLRGSTLKNTGWIIGVVVYTGFDTKIMQNSRSARTKMSRMEVLVNKCIRLVSEKNFFLWLFFLLKTTCTHFAWFVLRTSLLYVGTCNTINNNNRIHVYGAVCQLLLIPRSAVVLVPNKRLRKFSRFDG
jgi:phospholipid-transporting ATPase